MTLLLISISLSNSLLLITLLVGTHSDIMFALCSCSTECLESKIHMMHCTFPPDRNSDYNNLSRTLNFAVGKTVVCENITIQDDRTQEMDESFFISLTRTRDLDSRIVIDQDQGRVTINDSDRE